MNRPAQLLAAYAATAPPMGPSGPAGRIVEVGQLAETGFIPAAVMAVWAAIKWAAANLGIWLGAEAIYDLATDDDEQLAEQEMTDSDWMFWDVRLDTLEAFGNGLLTDQRRWVWRTTVEKARKARNEPVSRLDADMLIRELREVVLPNLQEQEQIAKQTADEPAQQLEKAAYTTALLSTAQATSTQPSLATWMLVAAGVGLLLWSLG